MLGNFTFRTNNDIIPEYELSSNKRLHPNVRETMEYKYFIKLL